MSSNRPGHTRHERTSLYYCRLFRSPLGALQYSLRPPPGTVSMESAWTQVSLTADSFVSFVPEYATRGVLLRCANLPHGVDPLVYIGGDEAPLLDHVEVHLFPGVLIRFLPQGENPVTAPRTLGQTLLFPEEWPATASFPSPYFEGATCLLHEGRCHLFLATPREAQRYQTAYC